MDRILLTTRRSEGFTLVELAIVMIIIGLLIGGILKGQELITNARIASTVAQIKAIDAATSTFQDKFNGMPGDLVNANARLNNCAAAPCNAGGNGNNLVDVGGGFAGAPTGEALGYFPQLAAADLLNGINTTKGLAWGGDFPTANIAGGFHVSYLVGGVRPPNTVGIAAANVRAGHYLALHNTPAGGVAATGAITANQAYRIDSKLDDGSPVAGSVFPAGAAACVNGNNYNESVDVANCNLYVRFHQ